MDYIEFTKEHEEFGTLNVEVEFELITPATKNVHLASCRADTEEELIVYTSVVTDEDGQELPTVEVSEQEIYRAIEVQDGFQEDVDTYPLTNQDFYDDFWIDG